MLPKNKEKKWSQIVLCAGDIDLPGASEAFVQRLMYPRSSAATSAQRVEYVRLREMQSALLSWEQFGHSWSLIRVRALAYFFFKTLGLTNPF